MQMSLDCCLMNGMMQIGRSDHAYVSSHECVCVCLYASFRIISHGNKYAHAYRQDSRSRRRLSNRWQCEHESFHWWSISLIKPPPIPFETYIATSLDLRISDVVSEFRRCTNLRNSENLRKTIVFITFGDKSPKFGDFANLRISETVSEIRRCVGLSRAMLSGIITDNVDLIRWFRIGCVPLASDQICVYVIMLTCV